METRSTTFDLGAALRDMSVSDRAPFEEPAWLVASREEPRRFWGEIARQLGGRSRVASRSQPFRAYDVYHDAVVRHTGQERVALIEDGLGGAEVELSYDQLGELVSQRAARWREEGVEPGEVVCVVRGSGRELTVSVLAAWKLGAVVSVLPPAGRRFLARRLGDLEPAHVDCPGSARHLLGPLAERVLPTDSPREIDRSAPSTSYPTGATVAMLFDPGAPDPSIPRAVTSDTLYLCALRDGALAMGLGPGAVAAMPGFHLLETEPAATLSVLLAGATFWHVGIDALEAEPRRLQSRDVRCFGVSERLRDTISERPLSLDGRWGTWFRDPAVDIDVAAWARFVERAQLWSAAATNLRWSAAAGGCTLFAPRRTGQAHWEVCPSAGVTAVVADLVSGEPSSISGTGGLCLQLLGAEADEPLRTPSVVRSIDGRHYYGGSLARGPRGRTYPVEEVLQALGRPTGCRGASTLLVPGPLGDGAPLVVLVLFAPENLALELVRDARLRIREALGAEFVPDRVLCYPLVPRYDEDGDVDAEWCRDQYFTGAFERKRRDELQRTVTELMEHFVSTPGDAAEGGV